VEPPHRRELKPTTERIRRFAHPDGLIVTVEELSSTVLLVMEGDIDLATVDHAMASVDRVDLDRITLLVVDLDRVGFVDLAGLHAILRINDECADHDVHLTVITPRSAASRVFTLTRAHLELDLVDAGVGPGR
jgi:anti-anti-sigma factor